MPVVVKDKISRNAGHGYGHVRVQRIEGVTADGIWTADTLCITADGRIVCIPATVAEPATALDAFDAIAEAGGGVVDADLAEAVAASDLADAVSDLAADAIEAAEALDTADAISSVSADALEPANALDELDAVTDVAADAIEAATAIDDFDAAVGAAQILFGTVVEAADALDQLASAVVPAELPVADGGGQYYPPLQRPFPVVGRGYGILPQLWGEAHGVVGVAGQSAAQVLVRAAAVGACGQAGNATAVLKALTVAGQGAVGARGSGSGMIVKFSGSATGRLDDDEAAVIAFLLAA